MTLVAAVYGCSSEADRPGATDADAAEDVAVEDTELDATASLDADAASDAATGPSCPGGWGWDGDACAPLCDPPCEPGYVCGEGPTCLATGVVDAGADDVADSGDVNEVDAGNDDDATDADPTRPVCPAADEDDCGRYCQAVATCMLGERLNRELLAEGYDELGIDPSADDPCAACVATCRASIGEPATAEYAACALAVDELTACEGEFVGFSRAWSGLIRDCCVDTSEPLCSGLCAAISTNSGLSASFPQCLEGS